LVQALAAKRASNLGIVGYLWVVKLASELVPVEPEKLKPVPHDKLEQMQ
jgi:hypothetical protein